MSQPDIETTIRNDESGDSVTTKRAHTDGEALEE